MRYKRILTLLISLTFLASSCSSIPPSYPLGGSVDLTKPYAFYHAYGEIGEDAGYADTLKTITASMAKKRLEAGECLSVILSSDSCNACSNFLPTFRSLYSEIGLECFRMDRIEAKSLKETMGYPDDSKLGDGTPSWFFLSASSVMKVLYPSTSYQDALKRAVQNAYSSNASAYNAYRVYDLDSFNGLKDEAQNLYYLDFSDDESVAEYKESVLPSLKESLSVSLILDATFLSEEEKEAAEAAFPSN